LETKYDRYQESFEIHIVEAGRDPIFNSTTTKLNEIVKNEIKFLVSASKIKLIDTKSTSIKGNPAYVLSYEDNSPRFGKSKTMEVLMLNGDKLEVLVFYAKPTTYSVYLPIIEKMITSLEVRTPIRQ